MYWSGSLGWTVGLAAIVAWAVIAVFSMWSNTRVRELEIRERIAMIERGLVPPPEVDPGGFDRAMHRYDRHRHRSLGRHRRAGIILIGIGFGLMALIGLGGDEPRRAVGVGGFMVVLGLAFFVAGVFDDRSRLNLPGDGRAASLPGRSDPPPPPS